MARAGWVVLGVVLLAAGIGWSAWVTYGPVSGWEGPAAALRYTKPAVLATLVLAGICWARALRVPR